MESKFSPCFCKKCKFVTCHNHTIVKTSEIHVLSLEMRVGVLADLTLL